jgi:hypothetical protein
MTWGPAQPSGTEDYVDTVRKGQSAAHWLADAPWALYLVFGLSEVVAMLCLIGLWRRKRDGFGRRLFWSAVLLIPVIGPVAYGGFYEMPSVQSPEPGRSDQLPGS